MPDNNDLTEINEAISRIGREVEDTAREFTVHEKVEAIQYKNMEAGIAQLAASIKEILIEMRNNRTHFDDAINNQQNHVDEKISECHNDLKVHIDTNYMTKDAVTVFRDETLNQAKIERRSEVAAEVLRLEKIIESNNSGVYKNAKSHLTLIWLMAAAFYGMGSYVFIEFKNDFKSHVNDSIGKAHGTIAKPR